MAQPSNLLATQTPFVLLQPIDDGSGGGWQQNEVLVWIDIPAPRRSSARLGALRWKSIDNVDSQRIAEGIVPLHAISDIRIGKHSAAMQSPVAASLAAVDCFTVRYTVPAAAASSTAGAVAATASDFRGTISSVLSLELASMSNGEQWVAALLELLETALRRRLLSTAAFAALSPPVPAAMLHAAEGGVECVLHSLSGPELSSTRSLLWLDFAADCVCWAPLLPADSSSLEASSLGAEKSMPLGSVTDLFVGQTNDAVWTAAAARNPPRDDCMLSLHAEPSGNDDGSANSPQTLHIETLTAAGQQLLLEAIQYTNVRSGAGLAVQGIVVVDVTPDAHSVAPRFFVAGGAQSNAAGVPSASASSAALVSASPSSSLSDAPDAVPAADLSADPELRCLVGPGLAVTLLFPSASGDTAVDAVDSTLLYAHEINSGMDQIRWTCTNGAAGRANFQDVSDLFLQDSCALCPRPKCCLLVHASEAGVRQKQGQAPAVVENFRLHVCTATENDRTELLQAVQHVLRQSGAAVEQQHDEHTAAAAPAVPPNLAATAAKLAAAAVLPAPSPPRPSKLRAPSKDLSVAAVQAALVGLSIVPPASSPGASPAASPAAAAASKTPGRAAKRNGMPAASPSASALAAAPASSPVPASAAPKLPRQSSLNSLATPRKKIDTEAEERRAKEAETETRKRAVLAAAAADKLRAAKNSSTVSASAAGTSGPPALTRSGSVKKAALDTGARVRSASKDPQRSPPSFTARASSVTRAAPTLTKASSVKKTPAGSPIAAAATASTPAGSPPPFKRAASHAATSSSATSAASKPSAKAPLNVKTPRTTASASSSRPSSVKKKPTASPRPDSASSHTLSVPAVHAPAHLVNESPMPVSSPAVVHSPDSFGSSSSSPPLLNPYTSLSADAEVEKAILGSPAPASPPQQQSLAAAAIRASLTPGEYNPEDDSALNFSLDLSGGVNHSVSAAAAAVPPVDIAQVSPGPAAAVATSQSGGMLVALSPMRSSSPPPDSFEALPSALELSPANNVNDTIASPTGSIDPSPAPFSSTNSSPPLPQSPPVQRSLFDDVEEKLAEAEAHAAVAHSVEASQPIALEAPLASMYATHVAAADLVATKDAEDDDFVIVQGVGNSAELAAASAAGTVTPVAQTATVAAPLQPLVLTPLARALQVLDAGCAFTSFSLVDPSDPRSTLQRTEILLWVRAHALSASSAGARNSAAGGTLCWCPLTPSHLKVTSPLRSWDISWLIDLFMGKQTGLFISREELVGLEDEKCCSFVAALPPGFHSSAAQDSSDPSHVRLDLLAHDTGAFEKFMDAFNLILTGDPVDIATAASPVPQEKSNGELVSYPDASSTRVMEMREIPICVGQKQQQNALSAIQILTVDRSPEVSVQSLLVERCKDFDAEDIAAIRTWCLLRMRQGMRVDVFSSSPASSSKVTKDRCYMSFHPHDGEGGSITLSRCELEENELSISQASAVCAAASTDSPLQRKMRLADLSQIILGRFSSSWCGHPDALLSSSLVHGRHIGFVAASDAASPIDVEFDSIEHVLVWILGVALLRNQPLDHDAAAGSIPTAELPVPGAVQNLERSIEQLFHSACISQWASPLLPTADSELSLLSQGALFQLLSPSSSSEGARSQVVHVFYSFQSRATDGAWGSLYWNEIPSGADADRSLPKAPLVKSPHRRLQIADLEAILFGELRGRKVSASLFFLQNEQRIIELQDIQGLRTQGETRPNQCLSMVGSEESLHLVWLRAADGAHGASALESRTTQGVDSWVSSVAFLLERAGRSLVVEATAGPRARWMSVTGGGGTSSSSSMMDEEDESIEQNSSAAPLPIPSIASSQTLLTIKHTPATPSALSVQSQSPEYAAAASLLRRGRTFHSYSFEKEQGVTVVVRKQVTVFFSVAIPPAPLCPMSLFSLPPSEGKDRFPALWALEQIGLTQRPPTMLRPEDMIFARAMSLHEVEELRSGTDGSDVFRDQQAMVQFVFSEDSCLTLRAVASTERNTRTHIEWNLQAINPEGLDEWIHALSVVLPVQIDEAEDEQESSSIVVSSAAPGSTSSPAAAAPLSVTTAFSLDRSSSQQLLSPVSALRHGHNFVLLQPARVGHEQPLRSMRVQLVYLSAEDMDSLGVDLHDPVVFPSNCVPIAGGGNEEEDEFQGALYWRPLQTDASLSFSSAGAELRLADLRAEQCIPLHCITDLFIGKETALLRSESGAGLEDASCFSVVSSSAGVEWNLCSLAEGPAGPMVVTQFIEALSRLLDRAGKSLEGEDGHELNPLTSQPLSQATQTAAAGAAVLESSLGPQVCTTGTPTVTNTGLVQPTAFVGRMSDSGDEADQRSHGVSGMLPSPLSPTQSFLLSADSTMDHVLAVMADAAHKNDSALHEVGVKLLYGHVAALQAHQQQDSSPSNSVRSLSAAVERGVGAQVVESMLSFPRSETLNAQGCGILWMLSLTPENERDLVNQGAITAVIAALQNHVQSASVIHAAVGALRNLATLSEHATAMGDASGIEALLACIKSHPSSASICTQALGAIATLCSSVQTNRTHFATLGGIEIILAALAKFPEDPKVHTAALATLRILASSMDVETKKSLLQFGAIEAIVGSMTRFTSERPLQAHVAGALWNLSANCKEVKERLVRSGGLDALMQCWDANPENEDLASLCCGALRSVSELRDTDSRDALANAGALEAILESMRRFASSRAVQEACCGFLFNLAESAEHAQSIVRLGGAELVVSTLRLFVRNASIVEECCGTLWMIARAASPDLSSQVIALADETLAAHLSHASVLKYARGMRDAWLAADQGSAEDSSVVAALTPILDAGPSPRPSVSETSAPPVAAVRELHSPLFLAEMSASSGIARSVAPSTVSSQ